MNKKGIGLVEILVSMVVLTVAALAVASTISMVSSRQTRSHGGSSLDLQALSFARETLDTLKNNVSTNTAAGGHGFDLLDTSYATTCGAPAVRCCTAPAEQPCGPGTQKTPTGAGLTAGLPSGSDLYIKGGADPTRVFRTYLVQDISSGDPTPGRDVAYKRVTVTVQWED